MFFRTFFWKLFSIFSLFALLPMVVIALILTNTIRDFVEDQQIRELTAQTLLLENDILSAYISGDEKAVDLVCKRPGKEVHTRFTVISKTGGFWGIRRETLRRWITTAPDLKSSMPVREG